MLTKQQQDHKEFIIFSQINPSSMASSTTKISCIEDCDGQDNKDEKSGILSAVNLLSKVYMSPKSIEEEEVFFQYLG